MTALRQASRLAQASVWGLPGWYVLLCLVVSTVFAATQTWSVWLLLAIPLAQKLYHVRLVTVYMVLMISLPLSTSQSLPYGLSSDLPAEQLMWYMTVVGVLLLWMRWPEVPAAVIRHPITLFASLIPLWIGISAITSIDGVQSVKYLLAKLWYMAAFFYMPLYVLRRLPMMKRALWWLLIGTIATVTIIMVRHSLVAFSFAEVNRVLSPFYRNHVDYACLLALTLPFGVWLMKDATHRRHRRWWFAAILMLVIAVILSYTRAAIIAMVVCPAVYFIVKWRLSLLAIAIAALIAVAGVYAMLEDYRYMKYAPDFETTIHHKDFGNLLEATAQGADVSTMERFHRWIAGVAMFQERPIMGFGAANFVVAYRGYTNKSFRTWVSDNEEGSGIHNYFLMIAVEQGLIGLLLFLGLNVAAFMLGQRAYHQLRDPMERGLVMAALTSIFITLLILLMNDMIEAQKVGPIYFLCLAIVVRSSLLHTSDATT